ncbi:hypothetical protein ABBQ32_008085 [Trebouxia sp. C0010 RCD-2024]
MHKLALESARRFVAPAPTAGIVRSTDSFAIAGVRGFASKTSTGPHGGSGSSPNSSKDNPPPQSPPGQSMEVSPEVPQHEAADNIPNQVPNQLGGERFPDALEADNTVTRVPEKALPKEKAS